MEKKEIYFDLMKINKNALVNIIKCTNPYNKDGPYCIILYAIYRTNKIVIHTYNFLKLYILYLFERNEELPIIDVHFVKMIMKVVSIRADNRGGRSSKETLKTIAILTDFYNKFYKPTIDENDIVYDDKLSRVLDYEAADIVKNINTNIKEHYVDYVKKFINVKFGWKQRIAKINNNKKLNLENQKKMKCELFQEFYNIRSDILNVDNNNLSSLNKYHDWIKIMKKKIIPKKEFKKDSVYYDIRCDPQKFLKPMIFINSELERLSTEDNPIKLFNVLPLRTSVIPSYVTFDTTSLVHLFIKTDAKKYTDNINKYKEELWKKFFHTKKRVFKKNGYEFHYMIKTDGIACSILFDKVDELGNSIEVFNLKHMEELADKEDKRYIENQENIKRLLRNKNYVCIDPNLSDLIYCMDPKKNKFRYTQNQRIKETGTKKYRRIIEERKKEPSIRIMNGNKIIDTVTIKQMETKLSEFNSKTCDFGEFIKYLRMKNAINYCLYSEYVNGCYRKYRWKRYMNCQRSEDKMLNRFENKFGDSRKTTIIMGDYDNKGIHMKGKEPAITKRFRKLFRKRGYKVYLINEFRTSMLCNKCHEKVETFQKRESKKPCNKGKITKVWGLVRCTNKECKPHMKVRKPKNKYGVNIYNRDTNAVVNMINIVKSLIETGERPKKFTRLQP